MAEYAKDDTNVKRFPKGHRHNRVLAGVHSHETVKSTLGIVRDQYEGLFDSAKHIQISTNRKLPWEGSPQATMYSSPMERTKAKINMVRWFLGKYPMHTPFDWHRKPKKGEKEDAMNRYWAKQFLGSDDLSEIRFRPQTNSQAEEYALWGMLVKLELDYKAKDDENTFKDELRDWIVGRAKFKTYENNFWVDVAVLKQHAGAIAGLLFGRSSINWQKAREYSIYIFRDEMVKRKLELAPHKKELDDSMYAITYQLEKMMKAHSTITEGFIDDMDLLKFRTTAYLEYLRSKVPVTPEECYLYYKYIILDSPIDFKYIANLDYKTGKGGNVAGKKPDDGGSGVKDESDDDDYHSASDEDYDPTTHPDTDYNPDDDAGYATEESEEDEPPGPYDRIPPNRDAPHNNPPPRPSQDNSARVRPVFQSEVLAQSEGNEFVPGTDAGELPEVVHLLDVPIIDPVITPVVKKHTPIPAPTPIAVPTDIKDTPAPKPVVHRTLKQNNAKVKADLVKVHKLLERVSGGEVPEKIAVEIKKKAVIVEEKTNEILNTKDAITRGKLFDELNIAKAEYKASKVELKKAVAEPTPAVTEEEAQARVNADLAALQESDNKIIKDREAAVALKAKIRNEIKAYAGLSHTELKHLHQNHNGSTNEQAKAWATYHLSARKEQTDSDKAFREEVKAKTWARLAALHGASDEEMIVAANNRRMVDKGEVHAWVNEVRAQTHALAQQFAPNKNLTVANVEIPNQQAQLQQIQQQIQTVSSQVATGAPVSHEHMAKLLAEDIGLTTAMISGEQQLNQLKEQKYNIQGTYDREDEDMIPSEAVQLEIRLEEKNKEIEQLRQTLQQNKEAQQNIMLLNMQQQQQQLQSQQQALQQAALYVAPAQSHPLEVVQAPTIQQVQATNTTVQKMNTAPEVDAPKYTAAVVQQIQMNNVAKVAATNQIIGAVKAVEVLKETAVKEKKDQKSIAALDSVIEAKKQEAKEIEKIYTEKSEIISASGAIKLRQTEVSKSLQKVLRNMPQGEASTVTTKFAKSQKKVNELLGEIAKFTDHATTTTSLSDKITCIASAKSYTENLKVEQAGWTAYISTLIKATKEIDQYEGIRRTMGRENDKKYIGENGREDRTNRFEQRGRTGRSNSRERARNATAPAPAVPSAPVPAQAVTNPTPLPPVKNSAPVPYIAAPKIPGATAEYQKEMDTIWAELRSKIDKVNTPEELDARVQGIRSRSADDRKREYTPPSNNGRTDEELAQIDRLQKLERELATASIRRGGYAPFNPPGNREETPDTELPLPTPQAPHQEPPAIPVTPPPIPTFKEAVANKRKPLKDTEIADVGRTQLERIRSHSRDKKRDSRRDDIESVVNEILAAKTEEPFKPLYNFTQGAAPAADEDEDRESVKTKGIDLARAREERKSSKHEGGKEMAKRQAERMRMLINAIPLPPTMGNIGGPKATVNNEPTQAGFLPNNFDAADEFITNHTHNLISAVKKKSPDGNNNAQVYVDSLNMYFLNHDDVKAKLAATLSEKLLKDKSVLNKVADIYSETTKKSITRTELNNALLKLVNRSPGWGVYGINAAANGKDANQEMNRRFIAQLRNLNQ
jgi:hypothetical protein